MIVVRRRFSGGVESFYRRNIPILTDGHKAIQPSDSFDDDTITGEF